MEFSVPMALADFVPVILFLIGTILLQRELYPRLSKGQFALFAAGTIDGLDDFELVCFVTVK